MAILTQPRTMGSTSSMSALNDMRRSAAESAELAKIRDLLARAKSTGTTHLDASIWARAKSRMESTGLRGMSRSWWVEAFRSPEKLVEWARLHADRGHVSSSSRALQNFRLALQDGLGRQRVSTKTTAGDAE